MSGEILIFIILLMVLVLLAVVSYFVPAFTGVAEALAVIIVCLGLAML